MNIGTLIAYVAVLGGLGGIANSLVTGEFVFPNHDKEKGLWRPGWIGNVIVGAIASVVIAGMYGPIAQYDLITNEGAPNSLKLSSLMGAIIVGMGGGNILTLLAKNQSDRITKDNLTNALETLSKTEDIDKNIEN